MKRLLIALMVLSLVAEYAEAQRIRVRRIVQAQADSAGAGDFLVGEPLFTTDTQRLYVGDTSGVVRIGVTAGDTLTSRYLAVPEIGAGTTGTAWVSTAYNINFYPFEVTQTFTPDSVIWYCLSANAATDSFRVGIYSLAGAVQCTTALGTHGLTASNVRFAQAFTSSPTLTPGTYLLAWQHNTTSPPSMDIINTTAFFRVAQSKAWAGTVAASGGQSFPATLAAAGAYQAAAQAPVLILIGE